MLFFFFFFFFFGLLFYSAVLPQQTHYSYYSSLLFSTIYIMKEYFLSCTALKMYSFLADRQKDAFKITSLSLKRLDASACSRLSYNALLF